MASAMRVLLVEDDEEDKFLTTEVLSDVRRTSYDVTWVTTASAAIEHIESDAFDVALLDFRLGAHTGLDVLAATRGSHTPCILLTGQRDHETDVAAMEAGAADYLVKGDLTADGIERSIRFAVDRSAGLRHLRESEMRFRVVVESATDAILLTDDDGVLLTWNESALRLFGLDSATAGVARLTDIVEGRGAISPAGLGDDQTEELVGRRRDGSSFPVSLSLSNWEGGQGRLWSAIVRDVTEQRQLEARLVHQAFHDPLTKLANRALFANRVSHAIVRLQRHTSVVGVLFLDLDDFKRVNDTLGHGAGDALLGAVAERLLRCVRTNDTVARLGGDEFAVLVEDSDDPQTAMMVADRIVAALQIPFSVGGQEVDVSCSIGMAITMNETTAGADLLRDADVAMYSAKAKGKNCIAVFEDRMHAAILDRVAVEADLRRAVARHEVIAHYQPILDLQTSRISGFEALARWVHPDRGLLAPAVFIDVAESTGLIVAIGGSILRSACQQVRVWNDQFPSEKPFTISVNLSNRQLEDPSIISTISIALAESGIAPSSLILEITESLMVDRAGDSVERLSKIAELGVRLAIDDFGTGYSSLSYLQDLPLSVLKVDRSFIDRIDDARGGALVEAIVAMSNSLGLSTIAEGIESSSQLDALSAFGCRYGQGYLFARPLPGADVERLLSVERRAGFVPEHPSRVGAEHL